ncbi:hypothetical protein BDF20DRAFT_898106 [Mycotypha africana]|uniref:uncharacterized protein n=1 Tax=Mycotypha africana TaxID=64632 RepID=UPI0023009094|nr:uncharacterized protein BDF20DRAFT_898106 [Mycotypha africana]KAI8967959.1 hypothetical protein BDF20DRAFT_898106 [Mycotypha africana]
MEDDLCSPIIEETQPSFSLKRLAPSNTYRSYPFSIRTNFETYDEEEADDIPSPIGIDDGDDEDEAEEEENVQKGAIMAEDTQKHDYYPLAKDTQHYFTDSATATVLLPLIEEESVIVEHNGYSSAESINLDEYFQEVDEQDTYEQCNRLIGGDDDTQNSIYHAANDDNGTQDTVPYAANDDIGTQDTVPYAANDSDTQDTIPYTDNDDHDIPYTILYADNHEIEEENDDDNRTVQYSFHDNNEVLTPDTVPYDSYEEHQDDSNTVKATNDIPQLQEQHSHSVDTTTTSSHKEQNSNNNNVNEVHSDFSADLSDFNEEEWMQLERVMSNASSKDTFSSSPSSATAFSLVTNTVTTTTSAAATATSSGRTKSVTSGKKRRAASPIPVPTQQPLIRPEEKHVLKTMNTLKKPTTIMDYFNHPSSNVIRANDTQIEEEEVGKESTIPYFTSSPEEGEDEYCRKKKFNEETISQAQQKRFVRKKPRMGLSKMDLVPKKSI